MLDIKAWWRERTYRKDCAWRARLLDGYTAEDPIRASLVTAAEMRWDLPDRVCLYFDRTHVQLFLLRWPIGAEHEGGVRLSRDRVALLLADPRVDTTEAFTEYRANVAGARKRQADAKARAEANAPASIPDPL